MDKSMSAEVANASSSVVHRAAQPDEAGKGCTSGTIAWEPALACPFKSEQTRDGAHFT